MESVRIQLKSLIKNSKLGTQFLLNLNSQGLVDKMYKFPVLFFQAVSDEKKYHSKLLLYQPNSINDKIFIKTDVI